MIFSTTISGIIAIILGYLIGSIPSAYIVTRIATGKDIRTLGTGHTGVGNAGTRNVFVNVGKLPGVIVAICDILKGAIAAFLAEWLLNWPRPSLPEIDTAVFFALGAGLAAVIGHIWPVYLKFKGGAGLATCLGVLAIFMTNALLFGITIAIVLMVVTRNVILSVNLSIITIPLWAWFLGDPWWLLVYPLVILIIMGIHFLPNIKAEIKKAGNWENLIAGLLHRDRPRTR